MTMTRTTKTEASGPSQITATQARERYHYISDLVAAGDFETAQMMRAVLYMDVLYSIANAPAIADKTEMKRLASVALAAFELPTGVST